MFLRTIAADPTLAKEVKEIYWDYERSNNLPPPLLVELEWIAKLGTPFDIELPGMLLRPCNLERWLTAFLLFTPNVGCLELTVQLGYKVIGNWVDPIRFGVAHSFQHLRSAYYQLREYEPGKLIAANATSIDAQNSSFRSQKTCQQNV